MNLQRLIASTLLVAALYAVTVLVIMRPATAQPATFSTRDDVTKVLWYLRGQADVVSAREGWTFQQIGCRARRHGPYVYCWSRVYMPGTGTYCAHALYRPTPFRISGTTSTPKPCARPDA